MSEIKPTAAEIALTNKLFTLKWEQYPSMNAVCRLIAEHTRYEGKPADEIATMWVKELARAEALQAKLEAAKQSCAAAAEQALQAAPDYESMHQMVRAAIMAVDADTATPTRHNGKTAAEWHYEYQQRSADWERQKQRAEAAEEKAERYRLASLKADARIAEGTTL
jgi:hypothetical protein